MPIHRKVCTEEKPFKPLPKPGGGKETANTSTPTIPTKGSTRATESYHNEANDDSENYQPKKNLASKMGSTNGGGSFGPTTGGGGFGAGGGNSKPTASNISKPMKTAVGGGGFDQKIGGGAGKYSAPDIDVTFKYLFLVNS